MNPIRVLLVDDSPTFLQITARFLEEQEGIVVVGAADGSQENLAQAPSLRPQVTVVDLGTPGLTNLEAVAQLRAMMPDVGIIAMSQVRATGYREVALAAGADDLVLKAALITDLLPAIRRAVENRHSLEKPVEVGDVE
jgi:DNA-binding NarL/FixJ family response regulator